MLMLFHRTHQLALFTIKSVDDNGGYHKWMNHTVIAKGSFLREFELKGSTWINDATVECRTIIAGNGMGYSGGIGPFDGRTNGNGD